MNSECSMPEMYSAVERKARKRHSCVECSAWIEPGETYLLCSGKWDGDFMSHKQHLDCAKACMVIRDSETMYGGGDCIPFGGLMDHAWEMRLDHRDEAINGNEDAKQLRSLLAKIKWRERTGKFGK